MYDVKPNFNINVLKNELGETFHVVFKLKNLEDHYLGLSQLYMTWRNENELKRTTRVIRIDTKTLNMTFCVIQRNIKLFWK